MVLLDPLAAYQQAESLLPRIVGLPSEREEEQHEAAAMDFGVFARLGVAKVGGWRALQSGAGASL